MALSSRFVKGNGLVICLMLLLVPRIASSAAEIMDPFSFSTAALASTYLSAGHVIFTPFQSIDYWHQQANGMSGRFLPPLVLFILSEITSIPIGTMIFYPVTGIAFVLLAYALASGISKSRVLALIYAAIQALDIETIRATNSLFYITMGFCILLLFIILYIENLESRRRSSLAMLLVVYLVLLLTYYGTEVPAAIFAVCVYIIIVGKKVRIKTQRISSYVPLLLLLFTAAFDVLVYGYLSTIFDLGKGVALLTGYLSYLFGLPIKALGGVLEYSSGTTTAPLVHILNLANRFVMVVGILVYLALSYLVWKNDRVTDEDRAVGVILLSLVAMVGVHLVLYAFAGTLNFRMFDMFVPLTGIVSLRYLKRVPSMRGWTHIFLAALMISLVMLPAMKFGAFFVDAGNPYAIGRFSEAAPSLTFFVDNSPNQSTPVSLVSSLDVTGQLFLLATEHDRTDIEPHPFQNSTQIYGTDVSSLVGSMKVNGYSYLIWSHEFEKRAIESDGWLWTPPAPNVIHLISESGSLNIIYSDGNVLIFARTSSTWSYALIATQADTASAMIV